ncbi:hypothetical protein ACIBL8_37250 [Streptomyces sp. NPDC050523]|uniref:hypothetical protein n=1 Tax=Streptomyces sp. NPDC050523 TaxID=3365622 RepID=UPI003789C8FF
MTNLMSLPDTRVRAITAVRDTTLTRSEAARTGRSIIAELPGFRTSDALASAIPTAAAPHRMAVYEGRGSQCEQDALGEQTHAVSEALIA